MKIRTLIVDDVNLARQRIRILLRDPEIEIIGECAEGFETVKAIKELQPDLVFLDVQMPEMDGFEVIESIGVEEMPTVIFVTAFDEFALRAFDNNAVDYLLKPFDEERLNKAIIRAKRRIKAQASTDVEEKLRLLLKDVRNEPKYLKRIPVKSSKGTNLVTIEEIDWIGAADHYLELHVERETYLIRGKITEMEQKLDPEKFVRIHRSTIVNIDRIKSFQPMFNGDQIIILKNGTELNMSRTYHEKLMLLLSQ